MKARFRMLVLLLFAPLPSLAVSEGGHQRVLAASCAACHGTNGNSVGGTPVLAGLDRSYFVLQMQAFRTGERSSTVMHTHAKGLTEEEIGLLAEYFSVEKRTASSSPKPLGDL
ncbi:MAG TPA: c-type cytochrome [Methylophilaceae bacterium]|nr:c-type cytochrome [Methylophilaceae bacterium]HQR60479.1 c-type cytochrome [Methylophilaceae bacterium]